MHSLRVVIFAIAVFQQPLRAEVVAPRQDNSAICNSGIYSELVPFLTQYSVATAYCSSAYPASCKSGSKRKRQFSTRTTKATVVTTTTRAVSTTHSTAPSTTVKAKKVPATSSSVDYKSSAWSRCQGQSAQVIQTVCSCIQTSSSCKKTPSKISSATTTTTTSPLTTSSTTTTTTSTSSTTTSTTTSSAARAPSTCPNGYDYSGAGCSRTSPNYASCHCELSTENTAFCSDVQVCGQSCNTSADCPNDFLCIQNTACNGNGQTCANYNTCNYPT